MASNLMTTYAGTYGSGTTPENALNTALLQYPEIARTLIQQYPRYSATYLLERLGRFAKEKVLGDNSFEWKVIGRMNKPSIVVDATTTYTAGTVMNVAFSAQGSDVGNFLNKYDMVRMQSGAVGVVVVAPVVSTAATGAGNISAAGAGTVDAGAGTIGDYVCDIELLDLAVAADFTTSGAIVASIGSAFPNGSAGSDVGENHVLPFTYKNYLTLSRKKISITGKDITDVTWIENNGHRLWYFTREQQMMNEFMYQQELQRWYGKRSITGTPASYATAPTSQITGSGTYVTGSTYNNSIVTGDGIIEQIDQTNQATYTAGNLTEDVITDFMAKISLNTQSAEGNEWVVFTGTEGRIAFHKAMKDLVVAPAGAMTGGSMAGVSGDVALGANFTSYSALGNKITVAHCPVFDDPNVHSSNAGTNVFGNNRLKESQKMVFLDFGKSSGVSNIELITKGAEGVNRSFTKKYVAGMINPYDQRSVLSANADDKFECHVLSESGIVVRNPLSCGVLSAT